MITQTLKQSIDVIYIFRFNLLKTNLLKTNSVLSNIEAGTLDDLARRLTIGECGGFFLYGVVCW